MSNVEKLDDLIDLHWDSKPRREALRFLMVYKISFKSFLNVSLSRQR